MCMLCCLPSAHSPTHANPCFHASPKERQPAVQQRCMGCSYMGAPAAGTGAGGVSGRGGRGAGTCEWRVGRLAAHPVPVAAHGLRVLPHRARTQEDLQAQPPPAHHPASQHAPTPQCPARSLETPLHDDGAQACHPLLLPQRTCRACQSGWPPLMSRYHPLQDLQQMPRERSLVRTHPTSSCTTRLPSASCTRTKGSVTVPVSRCSHSPSSAPDGSVGAVLC